MSAPGNDPRSADDKYPGAPAWVKVFVAVLIGVVVLFVLATVFGAHSPMPGGHGG